MHIALLALSPGWATAEMGMFLLAALQARGHRTSVLMCTGSQELCQYRAAHGQGLQPAEACQACLQASCHSAKSWHDQLPELVGTGDCIDPAAEQAALAALDGRTTLDEWLACEWQGAPVGEWTIPSLRVEWRGECWRELPGAAERVRYWLRSAVRCGLAMAGFIDRYRPDVLLVYDGLLPAERTALHVARTRGVRVVMFNAGQDSASIILRTSLPPGIFTYPEEWAEWRSVPLTADEEAALDAYLAGRRGEGVKVESAFSPSRCADQAALAASLGLRPAERSVVTAFCGVAADAVAYPKDRELYPDGPAFETQREWLAAVVEAARRHPAVDWVVRAHPGEALFEGRDTVHEVLADLPGGLPPNLHHVGRDDAVSSFDLMDLSRLVLVFMSTTGMEAAVQGLPVITASQPSYRDIGFVWHPRTAAEWWAALERQLADPRPPAGAVELARRYLYFWFLRMERRAAHFGVEGAHYVRRFASSSWLKPGRDAHLDRFCRYIVGEGPFIPLPEPERVGPV